jgi:CheY-like chemotaxis protein
MTWLESSARLPDLIVLDFASPGHDDRHFRERQLRDPRLAVIPIIVVRSGGGANVRGAFYLKKPLRLDSLAEAMVQLLGAEGEAASP